MFTPYAALPDGTITDELTTARDVKLTWRLDGPGEASFTLYGNPDPNSSPLDQTGLVSSLTTDLLVTWDGSSTYGWRGRMGANSGSLTETTQSEQWSAVDYRGVLARRYVRSALSYTGQDTAAIARSLIAHTHTGTAGATGIGVGTYGTYTSIDLNVEVGKSIGEQIDELGDIFPGFDWWVDPDMQFRAEFRGGGDPRDFPLEYLTTCSDVSWAFDPSSYANTIIQTGADGLVPAVEYAPDLETRPEGRWEAVASNPDVSTQSAVNATAKTALVRAAASGMSHTFTLRPGWTPEQLWIGDHVHCRYETSSRSADFLERVYEITVTLDGNGSEQVEVKVGNRLASDLAAMNRRIVKRLNQVLRKV